MKKCSQCKIKKPLSEFNFKNKKLKKYSSSCRVCSKAAARNHYRRNAKSVIETNRARNAAYRKINKEWKNHLSCVICGEETSPCIDFHHHNPSTKTEIVAKLIQNTSIKRVMEEARKCTIICSNCHRKHHAGLIRLTEEHLSISNNMIDTAYALVNPLASNQ